MAFGVASFVIIVRTVSVHRSTDEVCCGVRFSPTCLTTAAFSSANSGRASTVPTKSPSAAKISRYCRSVFGLIANNRATSRHPAPIRCNRTNSCN